MDTREMAERLGTDARKLRQFLRSNKSTYVAVGSAGRYEFTESDVETIARRFTVWTTRPTAATVPAMPKAKVVATVGGAPAPRTRRVSKSQVERDAEVWAEDGTLGRVIPMADLRDPRERALVKLAARVAADRLNTMLMAAGLHVSQLGKAS
jgi:hypothetical protein